MIIGRCIGFILNPFFSYICKGKKKAVVDSSADTDIELTSINSISMRQKQDFSSEHTHLEEDPDTTGMHNISNPLHQSKSKDKNKSNSSSKEDSISSTPAPAAAAAGGALSPTRAGRAGVSSDNDNSVNDVNDVNDDTPTRKERKSLSVKKRLSKKLGAIFS